jgi:hypothetical protein
MAQALPEERQNVLVVKGVEDHPSLASRPDDASISKEAQLMRHGGFGHAELEGQITYAQLRSRQRIENAHTGGIPEYPKDLGQALYSV